MGIKIVAGYETSDGSRFNVKDDAIKHQIRLDIKSIISDDFFRDISENGIVDIIVDNFDAINCVMGKYKDFDNFDESLRSFYQVAGRLKRETIIKSKQ